MDRCVGHSDELLMESSENVKQLGGLCLTAGVRPMDCGARF
jgi:hypothetical protein